MNYQRNPFYGQPRYQRNLPLPPRPAPVVPVVTPERTSTVGSFATTVERSLREPVVLAAMAVGAYLGYSRGGTSRLTMTAAGAAAPLVAWSLTRVPA